MKLSDKHAKEIEQWKEEFGYTGVPVMPTVFYGTTHTRKEMYHLKALHAKQKAEREQHRAKFLAKKDNWEKREALDEKHQGELKQTEREYHVDIDNYAKKTDVLEYEVNSYTQEVEDSLDHEKYEMEVRHLKEREELERQLLLQQELDKRLSQLNKTRENNLDWEL